METNITLAVKEKNTFAICDSGYKNVLETISISLLSCESDCGWSWQTIIVYFRPLDLMTFQAQYDMIVRNYEQYQQCIRPTSEQQRLMMDHYQRILVRFNVDHWPVVGPLICRLIWQWSKIDFKFQFKHVDKSKLTGYKFKMMPSYPLKYRLMIIMVILLMNLINRCTVIAIGKP